MFYHVSEFVTMVILDPYGMNFDAVGVFVLAFYLLFRSWINILWDLNWPEYFKGEKVDAKFGKS